MHACQSDQLIKSISQIEQYDLRNHVYPDVFITEYVTINSRIKFA